MEWQRNGELAINDLNALVSALQEVEAVDNRRELSRLSKLSQDPS